MSASATKVVLIGHGLDGGSLPVEDKPVAALVRALSGSGSKLEISPVTYESFLSLLKDPSILEKEKPDIVMLYRSGRTLPLEIYESLKWSVDEGKLVPRLPKAVSEFGLLERIAKFAGLADQELTLLREYGELIDSEGRRRRGTLIDATLSLREQTHLLSARVRMGLKARFLVFLAPHDMDSSLTLIEDGFLRNQAARALVPRQIFPSGAIRAIFMDEGLTVAATPALRPVYDAKYLSGRSAYRWNARGAELWAAEAAAVLKEFEAQGPN